MYISENDKKTFKSILLLNDLITNTALYGQNERFSPLFNSIFNDLILQNCIEIDGDNAKVGFYTVTEKGKSVFDNFMIRYTEYLKFYEVFAHVDTGTGEFGLASFFEKEEQDWFDYIADKRFEDMRIAVALFKNINPSEMIFMSFLREGKFDNFKVALENDNLFNEIEAIISAAIKPGGDINEDFMKDMINKGATLVVELLKHEKALQDEYQHQLNELANSSNDVIETTTETVTVTEEIIEEEVIDDAYYYDPYYYERYYDPYYISPIWLVPLFIW